MGLASWATDSKAAKLERGEPLGTEAKRRD
jgi:hypothetical protein